VSLAERLQADMTTAMRNGDALRRDTLRMVLAAAHNAQVAARRPLTDDELVGVLAREAKTRREAIEAFSEAGREDLAAKERAEADLIATYLPAALSEDELQAMVAEAIEATGASSARDLGKVMGRLSAQIRGRADGKVVSGMVAQELARADLVTHGHGGGGG
jgi:uncharacterized protein